MKTVSITFATRVADSAAAQKLIATAVVAGMDFEAAYVHEADVSEPDVLPVITAPVVAAPAAVEPPSAPRVARKAKANDLPKSDAPTAASQSATNSQTDVSSESGASSTAASSPSATTASPSEPTAHERAKAAVKSKIEADAGNRDKAKALITATGADSISKIPADQIEAFIAAVGKL